MQDLPAWLKHATVWLLLAAGLFLGVKAWQRQATAARFVVEGSVVELRRGPDGHYHWPGRINGRTVEFLVDTGIDVHGNGSAQNKRRNRAPVHISRKNNLFSRLNYGNNHCLNGRCRPVDGKECAPRS